MKLEFLHLKIGSGGYTNFLLQIIFQSFELEEQFDNVHQTQSTYNFNF